MFLFHILNSEAVVVIKHLKYSNTNHLLPFNDNYCIKFALPAYTCDRLLLTATSAEEDSAKESYCSLTKVAR
jgi:hypothetical protein